MTELHAANLSARLKELTDLFGLNAAAGDWPTARRCWLQLLQEADAAVREARAARIEADALATELQVYRPVRSDRTPAPPLDGFAYVFTAKFPWVCAAKEHRQLVYIQGRFYTQEHYVPDRKTLCGKATTFPVSERFTSGGWPRLHELCPDCTQFLASRGLIASHAQSPANPRAADGPHSTGASEMACISQVTVVGEPQPRTWDDFERGCLETFGGGHCGAELSAFQHGMQTVFNLLRGEFPPAEQCQAAPDLLAACVEAAEHFASTAKALRPHNRYGADEFDRMAAKMRAAVAKAAGR